MLNARKSRMRGPTRRSLRARLPLSVVALLALFTMVLSAPPASAEEVDWKQGKLGHLAPHIGTYGYDTVLNDPLVAVALGDLVGDSLPRFRANLQVAGPIDFSGGNLVLTGLAPHQGGQEEAMILIKIYDGTVRAALLHDGRMTLYARDQRYSYIPKILRDFLTPRSGPAALPAGVDWVRD